MQLRFFQGDSHVRAERIQKCLVLGRKRVFFIQQLQHANNLAAFISNWQA